MKAVFILLLSSVILVAACTSNTKSEHADAIPDLEKTALKPFTDTVKLDTFKIQMKGKSSTDMTLLFTITSFDGKLIYTKDIKASELLKSYLASAELKTEDEKIKFLNDEVNFFFDDEHFLIPAVTSDEKPDNNTPDMAFYQELKQTQLNGFDYRLGKDTKVYIAWSLKDQKVKIYYKCC